MCELSVAPIGANVRATIEFFNCTTCGSESPIFDTFDTTYGGHVSGEDGETLHALALQEHFSCPACKGALLAVYHKCSGDDGFFLDMSAALTIELPGEPLDVSRELQEFNKYQEILNGVELTMQEGLPWGDIIADEIDDLAAIVCAVLKRVDDPALDKETSTRGDKIL